MQISKLSTIHSIHQKYAYEHTPKTKYNKNEYKSSQDRYIGFGLTHNKFFPSVSDKV